MDRQLDKELDKHLEEARKKEEEEKEQKKKMDVDSEKVEEERGETSTISARVTRLRAHWSEKIFKLGLTDDWRDADFAIELNRRVAGFEPRDKVPDLIRIDVSSNVFPNLIQWVSYIDWYPSSIEYSIAVLILV